MPESFFSALKNERLHRAVYYTKPRAKSDVIAHAEEFGNTRRRRSELGYKTPGAVHNGYTQPPKAA